MIRVAVEARAANCSLRLACNSRMVNFLTLTANSNASRLDIFDFSDFFDFQADVPPKNQ